MKQFKVACWVLAAALFAPLASRADQTVSVQVSGGTVQLNNGSVSFSPSSRSVTWQLTSSGYKFTAQSVSFDGGAGLFNCTPSRDAQNITCTLNANQKSARGNYTVSVQGVSQPTPNQSAPNIWVVND